MDVIDQVFVETSRYTLLRAPTTTTQCYYYYYYYYYYHHHHHLLCQFVPFFRQFYLSGEIQKLFLISDEFPFAHKGEEMFPVFHMMRSICFQEQVDGVKELREGFEVVRGRHTLIVNHSISSRRRSSIGSMGTASSATMDFQDELRPLLRYHAAVSDVCIRP